MTLFLVLLGCILSVSWCWGEEAAEIAWQRASMAAGGINNKAQQSKQSDSWTDWVSSKLSQ